MVMRSEKIDVVEEHLSRKKLTTDLKKVLNSFLKKCYIFLSWFRVNYSGVSMLSCPFVSDGNRSRNEFGKTEND